MTRVQSKTFEVGKVIKSCTSPEHFKTCTNWMLDLVRRDVLTKDEYKTCNGLLYKQFVKRVPKLKDGIFE